MVYKDLMISSLTDLLEDGEVLKCSIYGILRQGNIQQGGYFGLTETHLLIVLFSGKQIKATGRIPLDVKSVKIKQTKIFKQYVIDISFNEGDPCRIIASPKVLKIDSQKQNLMHFLDFVKSKATNKQEIILKNSEGEKIRWQFFNTCIYGILSLFFAISVMLIVVELKENNFDFSVMKEMIENLPMFVTIGCAFLAPFIVLSLLNRFFFGKIVAVAREDGLLLDNDFILWEDIKKITFSPRMCSKFSVNYTYATIFIESFQKQEYSIEIMHFPAYGLRKIKKYNPNIKIEVEKSGLALVLFAALSLILISAIIPLIR